MKLLYFLNLYCHYFTKLLKIFYSYLYLRLVETLRLMNIGLNRNYPNFNIEDTFIFSKNYLLSAQVPPLFRKTTKFLFNRIKLPKKSSNLFKETDNFIYSERSNHPHDKHKPFDFNHKKSNSHIPQMINNFSSNKIVGYLGFLEKTSKIEKKTDFLSKLKLQNNKQKNSIDLKKKDQILIKQHHVIIHNYSKPNKIKESLFNVKEKKNISLHFKRRNILPSNRIDVIPNYLKLIEIIKKLYGNFCLMNDKNVNKLHTIDILRSLITTDIKYIEPFFFYGNKMNPIIDEKTLENDCIIHDRGQIIIEKLINPNIIEHLENFNATLEEYNLEREKNEILSLEKNIIESINDFSKIIKSPEYVWYPDNDSLKINTLIDDLYKAELSVGKFELIKRKEMQVGKLIDEALKHLQRSKRDMEVRFSHRNSN